MDDWPELPKSLDRRGEEKPEIRTPADESWEGKVRRARRIAIQCKMLNKKAKEKKRRENREAYRKRKARLKELKELGVQ